MKRKLRFLWNWFCKITTCVLAATAVFTTVIEPERPVSPVILWQILFVSFLCALCSLIYPWDRVMKKAEICIRVGIHYIGVNIIVLGFGSLFGWYRITRLKSVVSMLVSIAVIFAIMSGISWSRSVKDARKMNERLEKYQKNTVFAKIS